MLKIYTSVEKAKELSKLSICPDIDARYNLRFNKSKLMFNDSISTRILEEIEGMTERYNNEMIQGKFGIVSLDNISTGGKGLLLAVNYSKEFMINIDSLGYNCIYLLFDIANQMDIEVISTRLLFYMKDEFKAVVNGKECVGNEITDEMMKWSD